jgi:hypothetical protein
MAPKHCLQMRFDFAAAPMRELTPKPRLFVDVADLQQTAEWRRDTL